MRLLAFSENACKIRKTVIKRKHLEDQWDFHDTGRWTDMKKHAKLWIAAAALLLAGTILLGRLPERWTAARFQRQCRAADANCGGEP